MKDQRARYGPIAWGITRDLSDKGWVPLRYWIIWSTLLGVAVVVFYVLLTPLWLGLRGAARAVELRARLRARARGGQTGSSR